MLSLFYLPVLFYTIVRNYFNTPQNSIQPNKPSRHTQSKYSAQNRSSERVKSNSGSTKSNGQAGDKSYYIADVEHIPSAAEATTSNVVEHKHSEHHNSEDYFKPDEDTTAVQSVSIADVEIEPVESVEIEPVECVEFKVVKSVEIKPAGAGPPIRVVVALSESDDSELDEYLADIVSIEPSDKTLHSSAEPSNVGPLPPLMFESLPDTNTTLGFMNQDVFHYINDNAHVMIVDDSKDFPAPTAAQAHFSVAPNSFVNISTDPPQTVAKREEEWSSNSSPDTELSSYHGEQANPDISDVTTGDAGDGPSLSTNSAAAISESDHVVEWADDPMATASLTSQKNAPIKKYVPKERQKRMKSDIEWNQYMEKCMLAGARGKILNSFQQCYKDAFDAYRLCCDMLITFGITHASGRTVFQRTALDEIKLWKQETVAPRPSLSNQLKALDVSYLCNSSLFPTLREVYELDTLPPHEAVLFVEEKLEHRRTKYIKHMAYIISELKLQVYFDTSEMLLPLLAMDKLMTIDAYLCDKTIASTFVRSLDELLEPSGEQVSVLLDRLEQEFDYQAETAQFKFTPDKITTLIKRLVKVHGLDGGAAPNLSLSKTISNLKSIMFCRYRKGHTEDWTSTLVSTVQDSDVLQHALFKELVMYQDLEYAAMLYQCIRPKMEILPPELQRYVASIDVELPCVAAELEISEPVLQPEYFPQGQCSVRVDVVPNDPVILYGFVGLPPNVQIYEVASPSSLKVCKDALSTATVIGLDSEWRAVLDPTKRTPVALLQLAMHNACFLLDMSSVIECCSDEELSEFVDSVFTETATLLGYALHQDFIKLTETCQILGNKLSNHKNVVDLAVTHKHMTRAERIKRSIEIRDLVREGKPLSESDNVSKESGLARLCEMTFSYPLDKTYQVSDWTRRPLLPEQKFYAALDAYILLPLYYKLSVQFHPTPLQDLKAEVSAVPEECKSVSYIPASVHPTPSNMLRVIVDVPCQGLGKKLRHLGVDCVILEDTQSIDDAAKISMAEGRIILSRDGNCKKLVKLTDPGRVYKVSGGDATDQLAEVRQHFNLLVNEEDLFSRCAICNCPYFLKLSSEQARELKQAQEVYNSSTIESRFEVYERRMKSPVETVSVTTDGVTQYGVRLQLDKVKMNKFNATRTFWGCYDCGKMYWDGCHIRHFKEKHKL